ncbi:Hemolysin C [Rubripirellula lacrimiformis]|uniref:Hemolysin C n=1 Tax=Rubripirellula lacrimiformis TaxID=1930273 RepID=A0A517N4W9_9BACT|nr:hemolysin family protein [Rubripirellula lacrimiformis]QDT02058.1 Hemolysin C [Rubripirellula lacrimiformis]
MDYVLLLTYLSVAIGFSFLCSIAEAVLLSITPSYIAQLRKDTSKSAQRIISLKADIDRPLSAILSLNTIAHTVGAAGVGAQAASMYGDRYVGVISAILTLLILVLSEIIPKTIGALHWRTLAGPVALFIRWLIVLMYPLVWLSEILTKWLAGSHKQQLVTRDEISAVAQLGINEGLLKKNESRILTNLLKLESIVVEDVMTPASVVIALEQSRLLSEAADEVAALPVSRIPLFQERRDAVTGFVLRSDLLTAIAAGDLDQPLEAFSRPITSVHEDDSITKVFDTLLDTRAHIAIVMDKFGGVEGIVTLEDVLETLLGLEIVDEKDKTVDMQQLARQRWKSRLEKQGIQTPEPPKPGK